VSDGTAKMSGQIFISYRRDDSSAWAGRLSDNLSKHFASKQIFIDVDLEPGIDFVEAIVTSVGACDVLIAVIGKHWLLSADQEGKRRLENPEDFVRLEIATALKRNIRVIPVLVDGALMPRSSDLPDDLKLLVRRNALEISHNRFNADLRRLVAAIETVLQKADGKRNRHEEPTTEGVAQAAFNRGLAYDNNKEYDKAINDYSEAIRLKPDYADAYNSRGWVFFEKAEYDEAINNFTEAIRLNSNHAFAYLNRGSAYYSKNEYDKAISDYTGAIRLKPDFPDAYYGRGLAYFKKNDYDKAIIDSNEAIRLNPNYALAFFNRGIAYGGKKEFDKAIRDYNEVIRLDPNNGFTYNNRGFAYYNKKEYGKAIGDYDKAIFLDPKNGTAYYNRGKAYIMQGNLPKATEDFNKANELKKAGPISRGKQSNRNTLPQGSSPEH
jgi:tetratricopeptide (TPR) repeat protein